LLTWPCALQTDLDSLNLADEDSYDESDSELDDEDIEDPIAAERKRRARHQEALRRTAGEPRKPEIVELRKLNPNFLVMLRNVLAG
jgi:hypothetical protein